MSAPTQIGRAQPLLSPPSALAPRGEPNGEFSAFENEMQRRVAEARTGVRDLAVSTPANRIQPIDRNRIDPEMRKAAEGMEAVFLDYMFKTMRETVPQNEMDLENKGSQIYRSLLDSEHAERIARNGGIGLADQIIAYLQQQSYNSRQGHGVPVSAPAVRGRDTGGSHEGQ